MKKKIGKIGIGICTILFLLTTTISSAIDINAPQQNLATENNDQNDQIYLGYASIFGEGSSSILTAEAKGPSRIKCSILDSIKDFYIDYDIICNGETDEGLISLDLEISGHDIGGVSVSTESNEKGKLIIEDIKVNPGDTFHYTIYAGYFSESPFYIDHKEVSGSGAIIKTKSSIEKSANPLLLRFLENHPHMFPMLRRLLEL